MEKQNNKENAMEKQVGGDHYKNTPYNRWNTLLGIT